MATAFDERIGAVISSSSGAGGVLSARYFSEQHFGEGIELITRVFPDWFHPRLRFFVGREDRLPVDFPDLVALAAPRHQAILIGEEDPLSPVAGVHTVLDYARQVYGLYKAEDHLEAMIEPGIGHQFTFTMFSTMLAAMNRALRMTI